VEEVDAVVPDERKLEELIVLLARSFEDDEAAGATKLNKVLFYIDFVHHRRFGRPVTGMEYQKLEHGPAPRRLVSVRDRLIGAGDVRQVETEYHGRPQHRLEPLRPPDLDDFGPTETEVIDEVIDAFRGKNGKELSDLSHQTFGWQWVGIGETIPYFTAFARQDQRLSESMREQAERVTRGLSA